VVEWGVLTQQKAKKKQNNKKKNGGTSLCLTVATDN